ncbi:MAG: type II secretion system protein [Phycisphaerales bacterium JB061]
MKHNKAFTLIEVLVVITIVALLIAIILPALGAAHTTARQTLSISNVRSIGQTFQMYADTHRTYPFPGQVEDVDAPVPGDIYSYQWFPEGAIVATTEVWPAATLWPALLSSITPWEEAYSTWVSPGRDKALPTLDSIFDDVEPMEVVSYEYSNSFLASPRNWSGSAAEDPSLLGPIRPHEVTYTSQKVMLWDRHLTYHTEQPEIVEGHYDEKTPMVFADMHAEALNPLDASEGTPNPNNMTDIRRLHNTADGVRGKDY